MTFGRDGTSSTLLIGEIATKAIGGGDGANWVRGVGLPGTSDPLAVDSITDSTPAGMSSCKNVVNTINTPAGVFNNISFSSYHPGGCLFARADGSVDVVTDGIDLTLYKAATSRAGGEVAQLNQ